MNYMSKETSSGKVVNIVYGTAFILLLLPFRVAAQDLVLETQTIQSGQEVLYATANSIYAPPDTEFIVEKGGNAILKAGKRIELNTGFKILEGGRLSATLEKVEDTPPGDGGKENVAVFPNPTDGVLNVSSPQSVNSIRLIDMSGLTVMEQSDINKTDFSLDISEVKSGFYILEIIADKTIEQIRIEKN